MTRKRLPFNTGDCLREVTTWAGLTVYDIQVVMSDSNFFTLSHCPS